MMPAQGEPRSSRKRIGAVQSCYIPWKGFFDLIAAVDEFILYDHVQYTRRDWRNRNQIKTAHGLQWLTIPLNVKGRYLAPIKDMAGGEGYPKSKLKELYDCFHPRVGLVNVYGPTECTCICSAYEISAVDFSDLDGYPPLGALIPNFSYAILNDRDEAVPPGETGDLCLSGPCVGLGYFNDHELTQKAFGQNPLNTLFHEWTYRTGDLVRLSPDDGKIHFVGRKDNQIKHQGYRIELGEIEHALGRVS